MSETVRAKARVIKFDLRQTIPVDDPLTIPLLRLMMATDDVRHLQKTLLMTLERFEEANQTERGILEGELQHLFRLLCGHLYEAGIAVRNLDQACGGQLDGAVAGDERGRAALEYVRRAYDHNQTKGVSYAFLYPVRQSVGFHYKPEALQETYERHIEAGDLEGALTLVESSGLGRHNVTDSLIKRVIADKLGVSLEEFPATFKQRTGEVVTLAGALADVVDRLLIYVFEQHQDAIVDEHDDNVVVPPLLQRARERVERERR